MRRRRRGQLLRRLRNRRGVALVLTIMLTFAMGALAMGAIYVNSNGHLVGRMSEREKELRYAADAALQVGKSRLNNDPFALPDTGYATLQSGASVVAANGQAISNVTYNLYAGPTGSTTGQFGRFGSVISEAIGPRGARVVRRLELQQESFARYAYWTNKEKSPSGGTIFFANGDVLWGPVWSNDIITVHSSGATFNDEVSTALTITGSSYGTFKKSFVENANPIQLPTVTTLSKLPGYASSGSLSFAPPSNGGASTVRMRAEFVAVDLNNDGDSTDVDEGFVRVYQANLAQEPWLRADWTTNKSSANNCGDFHQVMIGGVAQWKFFPASVHGTGASTAWARTLWDAVPGVTTTWVDNHATLTVSQIMSQPLWGVGQPAHRCFLGGDPHLVAVERNGSGGVAAGQIGGDATTFTADGASGATRGHWKPWGGAVDPRLVAKRPFDAAYLFPLFRGQNTGSKGVLYFNGTVLLSGVLRGRVTVYSSSYVIYGDDLRYSEEPGNGICTDMLGVIGTEDIVVADNAINSPQDANGWKNMDDTKDLHLHGVQMALSESFTVENYDSGPTNANDCGTVDNGRGCLFLLGGLIQERRGAVGLTNGSGFLKRYSYDRCAVQTPPPYFPTTGRFLDNRYAELDPVQFNVGQFFAALKPNY
jgi:hypothetical protein